MHEDLHVAHAHALAIADLAGLAPLDHAVHRHDAVRHQRLACAAAVGDAGELEQVIEGDVVAVEVTRRRTVDALRAEGVELLQTRTRPLPPQPPR